MSAPSGPFAVALALVAAACLHAHWAFGGLWPARTEADLIRTVVGEPRRKRMPGRGAALAVAACLLFAAVCALLLRWPSGLPGAAIALPGAALAMVLIGRGAAGYAPAWRRTHPAEPFSRLGRTLHSPLCLALGAGFAILTAMCWSAS